MKALTIGTILLAMLAVFTGVYSCKTDKNETNDFLIKVDSIKVPEKISSSVPFDIEFFGVIGFSRCYSFKTFNTVKNGNSYTIEAWGTSDFSDLTCPEELISLDDYKLNLTIPYPGNYRVIIHEPGNYSIALQITVD